MRKLDGYYDIQFDPELRLVRLTTSGFWDMSIVERFAADIADVVALAGRDCDNLVNSEANLVHPPEVADALSRLARHETLSFTGRVAIVSSSALMKMQNKRSLGEGRFRHFASEDEASQWLASNKDRPL